MDSKTSNFPEYSEEQLKGALDSLLQGSKDPSFDGRHLFGFGDANHKLSKLQAITATRILDYNTYLVRSLVHSTTTTTKTITTKQNCFFFFANKIFVLIVMLTTLFCNALAYRRVHRFPRKKN